MGNFKNLIYSLLCLSFAVVIGAGIYEHAVVWPNAYAAPPQSLSMFQGEYGLESEPFWKNIHPIVLLLFIITLVLFWKTECKKYISMALVGYLMVLIITFTYFVPELIDIIDTPYSNTIDDDLVNRGSNWELWSLVRLAFLVLLALLLNTGLTKINCK